jgi:hypothetical protein
MSKQQGTGRLLLSVLAMLAAVWGLLGWSDTQQRAEAGFDTDGNNRVIEVGAESPAEQAGLEAGDIILQIAGYATEDARSLARLPRMKAGDTRVFTIERNGEAQEISIIYASLPDDKLALERARVIVGFCFLLFPLLALFRLASDATRLLAVMGIGLSLAFLGGPQITDASIRAMTSSISALFILFGIASLVQFLLVFPNRRPFIDKSYAKSLVYLPAIALWGLLAWRLLFTPAATSFLNSFTGLALGVVVGLYFLFALFRVLRNYSQTDQAQRQRLGLNLMLWGTVAGLLPVTIGQLASAFSPQSVLPGQDYYFLSLMLIPLTWARSASRG